jgi:AraC-like DNA-binding protein
MLQGGTMGTLATHHLENAQGPMNSAPGDMEMDTSGSARNSGEQVVIRLAELLIAAGEDVRAIFSSIGIAASPRDFLSGAIADTPREKLHQLRVRLHDVLARIIADKTGREFIRPPDLQTLFFCITSCRTLREAIERGRDLTIVASGRLGRLSVSMDRNFVEVGVDSSGSTDVYAFALDVLNVAAFLDIFSWLIAQPLPVSRILLDHPAEMLTHFDTGVLPGPITMNAGRTGFIFSARYLDLPVVRDVDDIEAGIREWLGHLFDLNLTDGHERLVERSKRLMYRHLCDNGSMPSLEDVSSMLGCSKSQFRRWLSRKGLSYNELKEDSRRELALNLLRRSMLPIEDISARLGYCDSDAFRQVFRRWTGMPPSEFRKTGLPV